MELLLTQICKQKGANPMDKIVMKQPYKVFVRVDDAGRVVEINSSAFITDTGDWVEVLLP